MIFLDHLFSSSFIKICKYSFFFSIIIFPTSAKVINRQAYKVCASYEEAYWDGSSARCCDTSQGKYKLVTNYINGREETSYACCEVKENEHTENVEDWGGGVTVSSTDTSSGWTIAGAVDGQCCSGWSSSRHSEVGPTWNHYEDNIWSRSIRQNGGEYYCASNWTYEADGGVMDQIYENAGKWCVYYDGNLYTCSCSNSGNPYYGGSCT